MHTQRSSTVIIAAIAIALVGLAVPASAGPDRFAAAEEALSTLGAALPGAISVPGGNAYADVPECDVAATSEALAAARGEVVQQTFGLTSGGLSARIVIFDRAKDAKRYLKLTTSARARTCIAETIKVSSPPGGAGEEIESNLDKGKLPGFKASAVFEGTIQTGPAFIINEYDAFVRVASVVVQVALGEMGAPSVRDPVEQWVVETAESF